MDTSKNTFSNTGRTRLLALAALLALALLAAACAQPAHAWAADNTQQEAVNNQIADPTAQDAEEGTAGQGAANGTALSAGASSSAADQGTGNGGANGISGADGASDDSEDTDDPTEPGATDPDGDSDHSDDVSPDETADPNENASEEEVPTRDVQQNAAPTVANLQSGNLQGAQTQSSSAPVQDPGVIMHRLYNPHSGEHLYTNSISERNFLTPLGWRYEGVGWIAPSSGAPVYRLYNPYTGDHHYTLSAAERDYLGRIGWRKEGIAWYSGGSVNVLRQFNPNERVGTHNFTTSQAENNYLAKIGWRAEGIAWKALAVNASALATAYTSPNYAAARVVLQANDATGKALVVTTSYVNNTYYLCLPSYADLTSLRISAVLRGAEKPIMLANSGSRNFTTYAVGSSVNILSISSVTNSLGARMLWYMTSGSSVIQSLAVMKSASIGALHINSVNASQGRAYVEASKDHSAKASVLVTLVGADGGVVYDKDTSASSSTIKGRGNSTWGNTKKPYQITLNKKADLLQTGKDENAQKKWILLANAGDPTLLRDTIAYNMALELGMVGTECVPVDVYYDGEYRGSYLLCEKIQIKEGRVNITDLEDAIEKAYKAEHPGSSLSSLRVASATNSYGQTYRYVVGAPTPTDYTGGYLLEIDDPYYSYEVCWFMSSWGHIVVKSPEYCSQTAMKNISEYVEGAIRNLNAGSATKIDIESLAKTYLVNEFLKSADAFNTSTFLYKDKDPGDGTTAMIYAQPVWDFDTACGLRKDYSDTSFLTYEGFIVPNATITASWRPKAVASVPAVQDAVRRIWTNQLSPIVRNVLLSTDVNANSGDGHYLRSLTFYRNQVAASQKMNQAIFGLTGFSYTLTPQGTYDLNVEYLRNWLTWRTAWLDSNIGLLSNGRITNPTYIYQGKDYGPVFDAPYYIAVNHLTNYTYAQALQHFVTQGMARGLVASRNFNVNTYRANYADLRNAFGNNLTQYYLHYIQYGLYEGRKAV